MLARSISRVVVFELMLGVRQLWMNSGRNAISLHLAFAALAPLFPLPSNATNQSLDWTTCKLLIRNGPVHDTRGLRPAAGSEAGEKNGQERVKTANSWRPRETTKSTGTRTNPRKHAGFGKKKTNPIRGWSSCLVGPQGLEPWTKGLCLPLRLSSPRVSLWSGLYLPVTGWPSSLYTFPLPAGAWLGIGMSRGI